MKFEMTTQNGEFIELEKKSGGFITMSSHDKDMGTHNYGSLISLTTDESKKLIAAIRALL